MPEHFEFKSPEDQLVDEMRRRIRSGIWHGAIPGIHRLSSDFGIGRTAVERALARLKESGDVVSGGQGLAMRAVVRTAKDREPGTVLAHHGPAEQATGEAPRLIEALRAALPGPVHEIRFDPKDTDADRLIRLRSCEVKNFVLVGLDGSIADKLVEDGVQIVAVGGSGATARVHRIGVDFERLVREAFAQAFAAGHRRVTLPLWRRTPHTIAKVRGWIAAEYAAAGLPHSPEFDAPVVEDDSPAALHACLRELFRITPPTALLMLDVPQWIATLSTLNLLRKAVGEDVSTILLTRAPELALAVPSQAHFHPPFPELVAAVRKSLREPMPRRPTPPKNLASVWVPGDSLGKPSRSGR